MNKCLLLLLPLLLSVFFSFSQDIDSTKMGALHLKFENYQPKKHGKYPLEIRIQSDAMLSFFKSNLRDRISDQHSWIQELPVGIYSVSVKLRSNFSLTVRKININNDRVRFIKIDMNDVGGAFRKVKIDREYRD